MITTYTCEFCKRNSQKYEKTMLCEAQHMGFKTLKIMEGYMSLLSDADSVLHKIIEERNSWHRNGLVKLEYEDEANLERLELEHSKILGTIEKYKQKYNIPEINEENMSRCYKMTKVLFDHKVVFRLDF